MNDFNVEKQSIIDSKCSHLLNISQNMFNSYPDIVTVYQLKEMLSIGYNKAYELVQTGAIDSIKVGKSYRITKSSVINFVLNR